MLQEAMITSILKNFNRLQANFSSGNLSAYDVEIEVQSIVEEFAKIIEQELWTHPPDDISMNTIPCTCGGMMRYKGTMPKTLRTLYSKVSLSRRYFVCSSCGAKKVPLDQQLGIDSTARFSPRVQAMVSRLAADLPYGRTQGLLQDLFGFEISKTAVEKMGEQMGEAIFNSQPCHELTSEDREPCDRFYIQMDGKLVPFQREEPGKRTYHECKVAVIIKVWTDKRIQVYYVTKYADSEDFGHHLDLYCQHLGMLESGQVIVLADGADWIWKWVETYCPADVVKINDWYHSVEYLVEAIKWLTHSESVKHTEYYRDLVGLLENGDPYSILERLNRWKQGFKNKGFPPNNPVHRATTYFENGKERMFYSTYEEAGHPLGTGKVEATNKVLIDYRFCQSGMGWSKSDVNKILALRTLIFNHRYKQFLCRRFHLARTIARI